MADIDFGTLTTQILDITNRDAATYTQFVQNSINTAITFMEAEHPYLFQKNATLTLLGGTNSVELPADLNQLIYAQYSYVTSTNGVPSTISPIVYGASNGFLNVTYPDLQALFSSVNNVGYPSKYALFGGNPGRLYVYPNTIAPQTDLNGNVTRTDYNIILSYYYTDVSEPAVPKDSSIWFDYRTIDCVRTKAIEDFYRYALQSPDLAASYQDAFQGFLQNLRQRNNSLITNMRLSL